MSTEPRPQAPGRKKGTACTRCRNQKIRCDDTHPSCKNCSKAGKPCVRLGQVPDQETIGYIRQLESRVWSLEGSLREASSQPPPPLPPPSPPPPPPPPLLPLAAEQSQQSINVLPVQPPSPSYSTRGASPQRSWQPGSTSPITRDAGNPDPRDQQQRSSSTTTTPQGETTTPHSTAASTSQIKPSEPLAHEVGLLSLANSTEPKYLGPSSGVPFARLILSAFPHAHGLSNTNPTTPGGGIAATGHLRPEPFPQDWRFDVDLKHFIDAYFDAYQPLYPFLDEETILERVNHVFSRQLGDPYALSTLQLADFGKALSPIHSVQLLLVIALGASTLETRLSVDFSSERYLASAISGIDGLSLHDSIEGLQTMLLLTLCSLSFVDGPNAWFLTSNIIAACLDLGIQRRWIDGPSSKGEGSDGEKLQIYKNVRRGIFWSAYSLERTLAVVLGRPLTLRDEAIDIEFPGAEDLANFDENQTTRDSYDSHEYPRKRSCVEITPYTTASFSFRIDQLAAEMKLMLYRVNNKPGAFPWLIATEEWQKNAHTRCEALLDEMFRVVKSRKRRTSAMASTVPNLEIKYHQCIMLLHRPSPATPRPGATSWKICYSSAVRTILIAAELNRFSKLQNTWLVAHNIFISGITLLYCLWTSPEIRTETSLQALESHIGACTRLLQFLGKKWSVAADALVKFERLAQLTVNAWRLGATTDNLWNGNEEGEAGQSSLNAQPPVERPQYPSAQVAGGNVVPLGGENGDDAFWSQFFQSELEDVSGWFDLNWMMNADAVE